MGTRHWFVACLVLISSILLAACSADRSDSADGASAATGGNIHQELQIVDPSLTGSSQAAGMVAGQSATFGHGPLKTQDEGFVKAMGLTIGSVYLETQLAPLSVNGIPLQASDVASNGLDTYVTYSYLNTGASNLKMGAVEHAVSSACTILGRAAYCMAPGTSLIFPTDNLFSVYADSTGLWVAGSTMLETNAPLYASVYKLNLDANSEPVSIAVSRALQSYAGTELVRLGSNLLVTTGTSTNVSIQGGLNLIDANTLAPIALQNVYDARGVAVDPVDATQAYVIRGAIDSGHPGAVAQYASNVNAAPSREIATGGNTIPESHASIMVGKTLLLTSLGDQGFRVSCKSSGASLAVVPAPVVAGVPSNLTVTNSVTAIPGYILAANGEAGIYIYQFQQSSSLNTSYCQGVIVTLLGRLSLASSSTYVNGELSANSIKYLPILNVLNVVTAKLIVVASGNKGVSMINLTQLTLPALDVDDF